MACIYQIRNLVNNKFYIGSTQHSFNKRKGEHLAELRKNYHFNKHLQKSWNKYGEENFKFEVIEELVFPEDYSKDITYEHVIGREMYYINLLNPEYNLIKEIRGGKLGRLMSDEEKLEIGKRFKGRKHTLESIKKIKEARAKQIFSEDHKRKISKKLKGNKNCLGIKQSEERKQSTREKVLDYISKGIGLHSEKSKSKRTNTLKIKFNTPEMKKKLTVLARNRCRREFLCIKDGVIIKEFSNQSEAAETLGFKKPWGISAVLNGEQHTHKGYTFKYKENGELVR